MAIYKHDLAADRYYYAKRTMLSGVDGLGRWATVRAVLQNCSTPELPLLFENSKRAGVDELLASYLC